MLRNGLKRREWRRLDTSQCLTTVPDDERDKDMNNGIVQTAFIGRELMMACRVV